MVVADGHSDIARMIGVWDRGAMINTRRNALRAFVLLGLTQQFGLRIYGN